MPSNIDPTFITSSPVSKPGMRAQLQTAKDEITALQAETAALNLTGLVGTSSSATGRAVLAAADAAAARTAIGASDGTGLALLTGDNTFTGQQTLTKTSADTVLLVRSTEAGASAARVRLDRQSASPAANDALFDLDFLMRDTGGNIEVATRLRAILLDPTTASSDGALQIMTLVNNAEVVQAAFSAGLVLGAATGGAQGTGTVNATEYYKNGAVFSPVSTFTSTLQDINVGTLLTLPHGLAAMPTFVLAEWECVSADAGWSIGDTWQHAADFFYDGTASRMHIIYKDATNIYVRYASGFFVPTKSTGNLTTGTAANWKLRVRAMLVA